MVVGIVGGRRYWTFRRLPCPAPTGAPAPNGRPILDPNVPLPMPLRHGTVAMAFSLQRQGREGVRRSDS